MLDQLEQQGYIRRMLNPQDRRSFQVTPTEQGQQAVEGFLQQWREVMQGVLEALTPTEQLVLVELLNKLQKNWPSAQAAPMSS